MNRIFMLSEDHFSLLAPVLFFHTYRVTVPLLAEHEQKTLARLIVMAWWHIDFSSLCARTAFVTTLKVCTLSSDTRYKNPEIVLSLW